MNAPGQRHEKRTRQCLHTVRAEEANVHDFVEIVREARFTGVGVFYSPSAAQWLRIDEGTISTPSAPWTDTTTAAVYEIRMFNREAEYRWNREITAGGTSFQHVEKTCPPDEQTPCLAPQKLGSDYWLLWGTYMESSNGWTTLYEGRVGTIAVPLDRPTSGSKRACLEIATYTREDTNGNVYPVYERPVCLTWESDHNV